MYRNTSIPASYKRILTMQDDITTRTIVQIYVSSTRYMIINTTIEHTQLYTTAIFLIGQRKRKIACKRYFIAK